MQPSDIVAFWMQVGPKAWFAKSDSFDAQIRSRFETAHHAAARGDFAAWAQTAEGAIALLLLLDQFPRNLYRGSAHAFATDPIAKVLAETAIRQGFDRQVDPLLRPFFYLPFEHSETLADQDRAVALFEAAAAETGDEDSLKWARLHRDIIVRFGRFPHRNACLGRRSRPEEEVFLDEGGFAG